MTVTTDIRLPQPLTPGEEVPEIAERIMQAAILLFGRKGYAATSVREIVQVADVTNPMLYYYFDSKEGLFRRLLGFLFRYMQDRIEESIAGSATLDEKLRSIARAHLKGVREHPEVLRFIYSAIFGPTESRPDIDVHAMHMRSHSMVQNMFETALESGEFEISRADLDASQCAELFLGSINQDLMRALTALEMLPEAGPELLEELTGEPAVERITAFFLGGVGSIRKDV